MSKVKEENEEVTLGTDGGDSGDSSITPPGGSGTSVSGAPPAYQPQQKGSGRFTNIKKYIGANQGAGEQISGRIGQEGESAAGRVREGIESSKQRFGQEVAGRGEQGELAGGALYEGIQQGREAATSAYQAPSQLSEDQRGQFQNLYQGGLQQQIGDVNLQDYTQQAQSGAQGLQKMAEAAGTEKGRFGLLRGTFARPGERYSTGQQRLDELFLQGTQSAGQLGQQLGGLAKGVEQEVGAFGEDLTGRQTALGEMAEAERTAAENLLLRGEQEGFEDEQYGGGLEDLTMSLEERLANMRTNVLGTEDEPGQYDQLRAALEQNVMPTVDESFMQKLQDNVGENGNIYNLNLADYLDSQETVESRLTKAKAEQLATQDEYKRFQGIADLLGREGLSITEDMAGTFNPYDLNEEELNYDLGQAKSETQNAQEKYLDQVQKSIDEYNRIQTARSQSNMFDTRDYARMVGKYSDPRVSSLQNMLNYYRNNPIESRNMGQLDRILSQGQDAFKYMQYNTPEVAQAFAPSANLLEGYKQFDPDRLLFASENDGTNDEEI